MKKPSPRPAADPRRSLPATGVLMESAEVAPLIVEHTRALVLEAAQDVISELRKSLRPGDRAPSMVEVVARIAERLADVWRVRPRTVLNATGIVLHTGLGRAVLPRVAVEALAELGGCRNLQIDLDTGLRGKRNASVEALLCRLTGAEAAVVVNNNAAATLLVLTALCRTRDVVVSRGQLIEIGGSYRLPDCIHQSGATLVEVGTTNKTHPRDYEAVIGERTGALLRVNPSNYRIVGFTAEVGVAELAAMKKGRDLLVIDDLGCGSLVDLRRYGLPHEPTVQESVVAGADIVLFSGDKLIGGPQAGIVVGRRELIQRIRKHPLTRMLRTGKMTDAALERTLRLFLDPDTLPVTNPTHAMLAVPVSVLRRRASAVARRLCTAGLAAGIEVVESVNSVGGGALPGHPLPGVALAVQAKGLTAETLARRLRRHEPPVVARIEDERVLVEFRTLLPGEDALVAAALQAAIVSSEQGM